MEKITLFFLFFSFSTLIHAQDGDTYADFLKTAGPTQLQNTESMSFSSVELKTTLSPAEKYSATNPATSQALPPNFLNPDPSPPFSLLTSFRRIIELGYSFSNGDYPIDFIKLNGIYAYKLNPYVSLGVGSGLRYALDVDDALIPFFADFRAASPNKNIPLYFSFDAGYSLDVTSDFRSEGFYLLINPTVGIYFKLSDKSALTLGIGYEKQRYKMNYPLPDVIPGSTIKTTGFSVNAGFSF